MAKKKPLRFSVDKKMELALQLISGASLEEMSRKTGRPAYELNQWKELFLQYGRTPEGNGVIERFFRMLKENLLWKEIFHDIESMRIKLIQFKEIYNEQWILQRHGYKSPRQVRRDWVNGMKKNAA